MKQFSSKIKITTVKISPVYSIEIVKIKVIGGPTTYSVSEVWKILDAKKILKEFRKLSVPEKRSLKYSPYTDS